MILQVKVGIEHSEANYTQSCNDCYYYFVWPQFQLFGPDSWAKDADQYYANQAAASGHDYKGITDQKHSLSLGDVGNVYSEGNNAGFFPRDGDSLLFGDENEFIGLGEDPVDGSLN